MSVGIEDRESAGISYDLRSADEEVRRLAVERLATLPPSGSVPRLIDCLGDSSWRVRKAAVERLTCIGGDDVTQALLEALHDGDNSGRRNSALEALIKLGPSVIPAVSAGLVSDDVDVRKQLIDVLAGVGDPDASDALLGSLGDPDPNVRAAAAEALAAMPSATSAEALADLATCETEDRLVRVSALRSLDCHEYEISRERLASALADSVLRPAAFALLGASDRGDAFELLIKGLEHRGRSSRDAVMAAILRIIGRVDPELADQRAQRLCRAAAADSDLVPWVCERMADSQLTQRIVCIQILGLLRDSRCVMPLLDASADEAVADLVHATLESLGETAEAELVQAWDHLAPAARRAGCPVLASCRGQESGRLLLAALEAPDSELRIAAAHALAQRAELAALPLMVARIEAAALEDDCEAEEEKAEMTSALVRLAGPGAPAGQAAEQAIDLCSARLEGALDSVRTALAQVIGSIGRPCDSEILVRLLKDADERVRRSAVKALGRIGRVEATEALRLALADEAVAVRIEAIAALGRCAPDLVIDDFEGLSQDQDQRVCAAALRAAGALAARRREVEVEKRCLALASSAATAPGPVAAAALEAIQAIGGPSAGEVALEFLERPESELLQAAVSCVGQFAGTEALSHLFPLIGHDGWFVRAEAISILAERSCLAAAPAILRRLELEDDEFVRGVILSALARLEA